MFFESRNSFLKFHFHHVGVCSLGLIITENNGLVDSFLLNKLTEFCTQMFRTFFKKL